MNQVRNRYATPFHPMCLAPAARGSHMAYCTASCTNDLLRHPLLQVFWEMGSHRGCVAEGVVALHREPDRSTRDDARALPSAPTFTRGSPTIYIAADLVQLVLLRLDPQWCAMPIIPNKSFTVCILVIGKGFLITLLTPIITTSNCLPVLTCSTMSSSKLVPSTCFLLQELPSR